MKDKIEKFLESGKDEIKLPHMIAIREFEKILLELGFEKLEMDGDEINGWQIDFWYKFYHPIKGWYMLSGSLYYGNFEFSKILQPNEGSKKLPFLI